jgi:hypothetical protein
MATATATTYEGTFHGRADEVARVRKEIAAYLGECPVADDLVLFADELASNSILYTKSRGGSFHVGTTRHRDSGPARGTEDVSTRVEGAEPPVILITAKATLAAGAACLMRTRASSWYGFMLMLPRSRAGGHCRTR